MNLVDMPIAELAPAPYNPRRDLKAGDREYESLKRSIQELDGNWLAKLVAVNTESGAIESSAEFRGLSTYGFVTFAPDGRSIFLEQYGDGATRTQAGCTTARSKTRKSLRPWVGGDPTDRPSVVPIMRRQPSGD